MKIIAHFVLVVAAISAMAAAAQARESRFERTDARKLTLEEGKLF